MTYTAHGKLGGTGYCELMWRAVHCKLYICMNEELYMNTTIFIAHLRMYLFSTIFCTFFFTSFLFFEGTFSSPYIKGKTKQNSCIINIYNCTRKRRVGGVGGVWMNSGLLGLSKDTIHCVHILIIFGLQWNLYSRDTLWTEASVP